jgi:hypothetical protein
MHADPVTVSGCVYPTYGPGAVKLWIEPNQTISILSYSTLCKFRFRFEGPPAGNDSCTGTLSSDLVEIQWTENSLTAYAPISAWVFEEYGCYPPPPPLEYDILFLVMGLPIIVGCVGIFFGVFFGVRKYLQNRRRNLNRIELQDEPEEQPN